jgi:hypothetical protein
MAWLTPTPVQVAAADVGGNTGCFSVTFSHMDGASSRVAAPVCDPAKVKQPLVDKDSGEAPKIDASTSTAMATE